MQRFNDISLQVPLDRKDPGSIPGGALVSSLSLSLGPFIPNKAFRTGIQTQTHNIHCTQMCG